MRFEMDLTQFKQIVLEEIEIRLSEKSKELYNYAEELTLQLAEEGKNSAGDKYETSRAMLHLEQEKMQRQFQELVAQQKQLEYLKSVKSTQTVQSGSLFHAQPMYFFIGIGLGKLKVGENTIFCVAAEAPLGKILLGKKQGATFEFTQQTYHIEQLI